MSADKKAPINGITASVIEELDLVPLDERLEFSPMGILDVLVANVELIDAQGDEPDACSSRNTETCSCDGGYGSKCEIKM